MLSGWVWTLFSRQSGDNKRELTTECMIKIGFRVYLSGNGNYGMEGSWQGSWKYQYPSFALYLMAILQRWHCLISITTVV